MDKRLTARSPRNNMAYLVNVKPDEQEVNSAYPNTLRAIRDSFERLGQYEDTGLAPEEVETLRTENERLRVALEATEAVKAFMTLPKSYYDDNWSDEKESRFLAAVKRLAEAKKALEEPQP